jgi:hypothetical protein
MFAGMVFGGFFGMMDRLQMMAMSNMRMMASFLVVTCCVVFRSRPMVFGCMLVVFRSFGVMFSARL